MRKPRPYCLQDEDIRYEWKFMLRWCRLFHKTDWDWVRLGARRFRDRYPLAGNETPGRSAA